MDEFLRIGKTMVKDVQETFTRPDDDWSMWLMGEMPDEKVFIVGMPPDWSNSDHLKEILSDTLVDYVKEIRPLKVGLISSTWQVEGTGTDVDEVLHGLRPLEHPDRFEAVIIVAVDPEIQRVITARIVRTETAPPTLSEWEESEKVEIAGRLLGPVIQAFR